MSNRSNICIYGNNITGENLGNGAIVFAGSNTDTNMQFKTILVTGGLSIITGSTTLTISGATGGGSGGGGGLGAATGQGPGASGAPGVVIAEWFG